jgi:hypothetical protein
VARFAPFTDVELSLIADCIGIAHRQPGEFSEPPAPDELDLYMDLIAELESREIFAPIEKLQALARKASQAG